MYIKKLCVKIKTQGNTKWEEEKWRAYQNTNNNLKTY